jgi:hypothetical protein
MPKPQIKFVLIPLEEIPGRLPVTPVYSDRVGSQWDEALNALRRNGGTHGIKVPAANRIERNKFKQTLQTFVKTHGLFVKVLDDKGSTSFFAWLGDEEGRFMGPRVPRPPAAEKS